MMNRRLLPTLLGLVIVVLLGGLRVSDPYPLQAARDIAFDLYQRLEPRTGPEGPVRVIDIDEASLARYGQWPWSRDKLALITNRLAELGAAAIGFDVLFPEPDRLSPVNIAAAIPGVDPRSLPDTDAEFATAVKAAPVVLGLSRSPAAPPLTLPAKAGFAISGSDPKPSLPLIEGAAVPLAQLSDAAAGLGSLSLNVNDDSTAIRQVPLLWSNGSNLYPALSIETLRVALGEATIVALGDTTDAHTLESVRVGPFDIPTTANGDLWIYYRAPDPSLYVSAARLLGDDYKSLAPLIAGEIVLIGTSASGLLDVHTTALGDNVPGVSIHAQAIDQIVSQQFLTRADWLSGLEILAFAVAGVLLVVVVLRLGPLAGLAVGAALAGSMVALSWTLFVTRGYLLDPVFPTVGATIVYGAMVYFQFSISDADRRQVRRAFGYYVAPELLTQIERNADRLQLGGELKEITVMFADMRGFTSYTERHTPQQTLKTLNTLFGALGAEIVERLGTIDKFIGDAIMAFWNAPVDVTDHARRATAAALAMRRRLDGLNAEKTFGEAGIAVGVGLSTGEALVGNMGLETRFDYSTIGDAVNVASRVEGESKVVGFDLLASEATRAAAPDFAWLEAGSVQLKGKSQRLRVHLLVGDPEMAVSEAFITLEAAHGALLDLLRTNGDSIPALRRCALLGAPLQPRLVRFYELVPGRVEDFTSPE